LQPLSRHLCWRMPGLSVRSAQCYGAALNRAAAVGESGGNFFYTPSFKFIPNMAVDLFGPAVEPWPGAKIAVNFLVALSIDLPVRDSKMGPTLRLLRLISYIALKLLQTVGNNATSATIS
jgi:hypothetical protein